MQKAFLRAQIGSLDPVNTSRGVGKERKHLTSERKQDLERRLLSRKNWRLFYQPKRIILSAILIVSCRWAIIT